MKCFDYRAYVSDIKFIIAAPGNMQQSFAELKQTFDAAEAQEKNHGNNLHMKLSQKKEACSRQYDEIRKACESIGVHVLPEKQHPISSQLLTDDAVAAQNGIAAEMKTLIDAYHQELYLIKRRKLAQQQQEAAAKAQALEQAALEAKRKEEEKTKAENNLALQRQLHEERARKRKEEMQKSLKKLIPVGIILAIILLIILKNH